MAMTVQQWQWHNHHRSAVAADHGQWVGLFNENAEPICDCPPIIEMTAPETRNAPVSASFKFPILSSDGVLHPIANELLADNLGKVDGQGRMVFVNDKTRFIAVQRPGGLYNYMWNRRFFRVTHSVASGGSDMPAVLEVHAVDELSILQEFPAPSAPTAWSNSWTRFQRDWAGPENVGVQFQKPRDLADIKMLAVADGGVIEGPADVVVRRIINESLHAAYRVAGISPEIAPVAVRQEDASANSPHVLIRPADESIWDTIGQVAQQAGLTIRARMWLPPDGSMLLMGGRYTKVPTIVVHVRQGE